MLWSEDATEQKIAGYQLYLPAHRLQRLTHWMLECLSNTTTQHRKLILHCHSLQQLSKCQCSELFYLNNLSKQIYHISILANNSYTGQPAVAVRATDDVQPPFLPLREKGAAASAEGSLCGKRGEWSDLHVKLEAHCSHSWAVTASNTSKFCLELMLNVYSEHWNCPNYAQILNYALLWLKYSLPSSSCTFTDENMA